MTVIEKKVNIYNGLRTNVLDDDAETNKLLRETFELNGLPNVEFFEDSELFVNALNENIHLCIVDQMLKGSLLQGIDVIRIIRKRFPKCQIIFVSGTSDTRTLKELIRLKPDGYVDKDEDHYMNVLVDVVTERLEVIKSNLLMAAALESYKNGQ